MVCKVCFRAWRKCCNSRDADKSKNQKYAHRPPRHVAPEESSTPQVYTSQKPLFESFRSFSEIEEQEEMARQPKLPTKRVCGLGIAGALVALYAMHVERAMADPFYEPMCVTRWGSCAAVFSSVYAHPLSNWGLVSQGSDLDFSLAFLGILNYGVFALFPVWPLQRAAAAKVLLAISVASCLFSIYLLYVLKVLLDDFCVVCTTFHVINFSTLVFGAVPAYRATAAKTTKGE